MSLNVIDYKKAFLTLLITLFLSINSLYSDDRLVLTVDPLGSLPLGSSSDSFKFGFGGQLGLTYTFGDKGIFSAGLKSGYLYLPLAVQDGVSVVTATGGPLLSLPLSKMLTLSLGTNAGYYYWFPTGWVVPDKGNGGGFTFDGELAGTLSLGDYLDIRLGVGYSYMHNFYNGLSFTLGTRIKLTDIVYPERIILEEKVAPRLLNQKKNGVELSEFSLNPVYPILYKYYDNNPVGTVSLFNFESTDISDVKVTFFVERYMDNPMDVGAPEQIGGKEKVDIDLYGLFTEDVMTITEGNKASARVVLEYTLKNKTYSLEYNPVIEFYNRNALTWDDDRKIAAFVNAKDPEILTFSRNITNWMQEEKNSFIDENLQKAMVIFESVKNKRIRYEVDPATPFSEMSEQEESVDFLQFPLQTFTYTSGDCDDLSILFSSLLEASGVETAFITIPGHIYIAFALKTSPSSARRTFSQSDNLIFIDETVWFPLEITMVQQDFLDAWETGAKEWRENNSRDQAGLYPTRQAWQTYQAVGFSGNSANIELPEKPTVLRGFADSLRTFINREIYPQVARIQARIQEQGDHVKFRNQLAVLYGKYGLFDMAEREFKAILRDGDYLPALVNMGNIYFIKEDYLRALNFFERAEAIASDNKTVLLSIAKVHHELENYGMVRQKYALLEELSPSLALEYAYLDLRGDEAARAAEISGARNMIIWEEEE